MEVPIYNSRGYSIPCLERRHAIMATRSNSSGNLTIMRIVLTVLGILVFTAVCRPSLADELPAFRQGLWKFERTVGKEKFEVTKCTSPSEDMRKQNAML
jgi:hypothetical protein